MIRPVTVISKNKDDKKKPLNVKSEVIEKAQKKHNNGTQQIN